MRNVNRLLAFVLGLAVIVAAATVVVEVIAGLAGAAPALLDWPAAFQWAQRTTWGAAPVRIISGLLAIAGLALVLAQLTPRRPDRLAMDGGDTGTDAAVTRRGLTRAVRGTVTDVDGIADARVTVRRRRIRVHARAAAGAPSQIPALRDATTAAARQCVDALKLRHRHTVSVQMSTRER